MIQKAVFAGGCFWCLEAIFNSLAGVESVNSGYTGGLIKSPSYKDVCSGNTGHAEAVEITFESSTITFKTLLDVFFTVHDPTTLNRQGNDVGTQYRSAIFYTSNDQKIQAEKFIQNLEESKVFEDKIITEIVKFEEFYKAEDYHKDYYENNKTMPYCRLVITPKMQHFADKFKSLLKTNRV